MAETSNGNSGYVKIPTWAMGLVSIVLAALLAGYGTWMTSIAGAQHTQAAKIAAIEQEQANVSRRLERIEDKVDKILDRTGP